MVALELVVVALMVELFEGSEYSSPDPPQTTNDPEGESMDRVWLCLPWARSGILQMVFWTRACEGKISPVFNSLVESSSLV